MKLVTGTCRLTLAMVLAGGVAGWGCGKGSNKQPGENEPSRGESPREGHESRDTPRAVEGPEVMEDSVQRSYDDALVAALDRLSKPDAEVAPIEPAGQLEVTLSAYQNGDKVDYRVRLDTSQQIFSLSIPEDINQGNGLAGAPDGARFSPPLEPSMAVLGSGPFVSASMLGFKAKQFDDGLYAAVELAADSGVGKFPSRDALLADLATALGKQSEGPARAAALGLLGAATRLGGDPVEVPAAAAAVAADLEKKFLADPLRSKPIGFYTWSKALAGVFRRDRLLQSELDPGTADRLARALGSDDLLARYRAILDLPRHLTNALARADLADAAAALAGGGKAGFAGKPALFPPSRAYETDLIKQMYGDSPVPQGFNLADEMVRRIQAGKLDLTPRTDSGWYDYQTYALEPLVAIDRMPEIAHLELDKGYRDQLVKLFKALLALTRETHIKQLEVPTAGAAMPPPGIRLTLQPQLSQEPLASFYLRRAQSYRFVRKLLAEAFGADGVKTMKRLTASGPVNLSLDRELALMEGLFYGAYLETAHQLGMKAEKHADLGLGPERSLALYRDWKPAQDPDVSRDMRMMVPVFYDQQLHKIKVWVVLGVTSRKLDVHYSVAPEVKQVVEQASGKPVDLDSVHLSFPQTSFSIAYPVMAEVYVSRLLDRDELRALCDKYKTQQEILKHLE